MTGPAPRGGRHPGRRPRASWPPSARRGAWSWSPAAAAPTRWPWRPPPPSRRPGPGCGPGRSSSTTGCSRLRRRRRRGRRRLRRPRARPGPTCWPSTVRAAGEGPEAAARAARYAALRDAAAGLGAAAGAARAHPGRPGRDGAAGAGPRLGGPVAGRDAAPAATRFAARCWTCPATTTEAACRAAGLDPWQDPHNADPASPAGPGPRGCWPRSSATSGPGVVRRPRPHRRPAARRTPTCSTGSPATARDGAWGRGRWTPSRSPRSPTPCARRVWRLVALEAGARPVRCPPATSTRSTRWSVRAGAGRGRCDLPGRPAGEASGWAGADRRHASGSIGLSAGPRGPRTRCQEISWTPPTWETTSSTSSSPRNRSTPSSAELGRPDRDGLRGQGPAARRRPQGRGDGHGRPHACAARHGADGLDGDLLLRLGHQVLRRGAASSRTSTPTSPAGTC